MSRPQTYVIQSMAASGFAIINPQVAVELRPDIFGNDGMTAAFEFSQQSFRNNLGFVQGQRYIAKLSGLDKPCTVITRSGDELATRIRWITGREVVSLHREGSEPWDSGHKVAIAQPVPDVAARKEQERIKALQALAAQEPPAHVCALRKDILAARAELERLAPTEAAS